MELRQNLRRASTRPMALAATVLMAVLVAVIWWYAFPPGAPILPARLRCDLRRLQRGCSIGMPSASRCATAARGARSETRHRRWVTSAMDVGARPHQSCFCTPAGKCFAGLALAGHG